MDQDGAALGLTKLLGQFGDYPDSNKLDASSLTGININTMKSDFKRMNDTIEQAIDKYREINPRAKVKKIQ
jgi:hypothetical protein